jgi:3-oxoacyl-[acyl-carrier-protein] synthase II
MTALEVLGLGVTLPGTDKPAEVLSPGLATAPGPGWFDVATALPGRGYKRLPGACQYLLAATRDALTDSGDALAAVPSERRGIVLATNNSGMALNDELDHTIIEEGAEVIRPANAPYYAMSLFASRLATEHQVHGFSFTVNSPRTAAFDAVQNGARALAAGRADVVVVSATEEILPPGEPGAEGSDTGAVALICTLAPASPASAPYGTVQARNAFVAPGADPANSLGRAWRALGADTSKSLRVEAVLDDSPVGAAVETWLAKQCTDVTVHSAGVGALTPMRHLVAGLTTADESDRIVVTAAAEGNVALARLSTGPGIRRSHHQPPNGSRP